eukprot:g4749.t1
MAQEDGGVKFLLPQEEPVAGHEMRQPPFVTYPFGGVKMLLLGYSVDSNHQVNFVEFGGGSSKSTSSNPGAGGGEEDSGKEDEYDDEGASPESQCQSDEEENEEEEEDLSASAGEQRKHDEQDEDERMSDYTSSNEDTDPGDEAAGAASRDELMASKSSAGGETESGSVPASATVSEGGRHPEKASAEVEGDDAMSFVHEPEPLSGYERAIEVRGVPVTANGALLKAPTRAGSGAAGTRNTNGHLVHMGKEAAPAAEGESAGGSDGVETGGTTTTSANGTAEPKGRSSGTGGKLVTEKQSGQSGNGSEGRRQQATTTRPGATSRAGKGMTGAQFLLSSGSVGANANNSSGPMPNAGELPQLKKGKSDDHGRSQQGAAAESPRNPLDNSQAPKGVAKSAQMKAPAAAATPATTEAPPALKARGSKSLQAQQAIQQISLSNSVAEAKQHGTAAAQHLPQRTARPQQRHHQAVLGAGGIQHQQQQQRPPGTNGGKNPNHHPSPQPAAASAHSSTTTTQTSRHLYTQRVVLDPNALTHLPNFQRLSDLHDPWSAFSSSVIQAIVEIPPHVKKAWSFLPCGDVDDVLCNPKFGLERFPGVYEAKPQRW